PSTRQRWTSSTRASIDFRQRAGSGLARLIRYDACATGSTMPVCSSADRKAPACAADKAGASDRLLFLVNNWTVWNGTAWAAQTARSQPPAIDMWAPSLRALDGRFAGPRALGSIGVSDLVIGRVLGKSVPCGQRRFDPTMKATLANSGKWPGIRTWDG